MRLISLAYSTGWYLWGNLLNEARAFAKRFQTLPAFAVEMAKAIIDKGINMGSRRCPGAGKAGFLHALQHRGSKRRLKGLSGKAASPIQRKIEYTILDSLQGFSQEFLSSYRIGNFREKRRNIINGQKRFNYCFCSENTYWRLWWIPQGCIAYQARTPWSWMRYVKGSTFPRNDLDDVYWGVSHAPKR